MKKVLIFSVAYHPFIGGAEIAVKEITDRLKDIEFHMITVNLDGKQQRNEKIGNVFVHRVGSGKHSKFFLPFSAYSRARRLMHEHSFDALWSIMASQASVGAAFVKMFYPAIPLVLTLQEGDEESHLKRYVFGSDILYKLLIRPWYRLVFRKADQITVISNYLAKRARDINLHVPIDLIPNGVDVGFYSKQVSQEKIDEAKKEMGKKDGDTIVITTSRLVKKNAVNDLIAALPHLPNSVKLVIIGSGELESELKKQAEHLKVFSRTLFLGFKDNNELPKYLAASDIFSRPSLSEGMGISFIEAMAAGIPVIATPVGGITDFLHDRQTGLLVKPRDPKDIAVKVEELIRDPKLVRHITKEAKALVTEKYDWDTIATGMGQIFAIFE